MQRLTFILVYPIILLISILPFSLLYFLSTIFYILVYHLVGYRKKVVRKNLKLTLPHLSPKERQKIEKKFYLHFCDLFLEMIKTFTISKTAINKRFTFTNIALLREFEAKNKSIILMCGHYASYEWLISLNDFLNYKGYAIYKKINNTYFNKLALNIRSKYKTTLIDNREAYPIMSQNQKKGILGTYGFVADQSPMLSKTMYWQHFMGIEVPVHVGAEILAKKLNMSLIYVNIEKVKRGHYQCTFIPLAENPNTIPNYEITNEYLKLVEKQIYKNPEYYLWTHKRWKHKDKKNTTPS